MNDLTWTATVAGATISVVVWARAYTVVKLATIRASKAETAQEFVMMERAAALPTGRRALIKRKKPTAPIPYGL